MALVGSYAKSPFIIIIDRHLSVPGDHRTVPLYRYYTTPLMTVKTNAGVAASAAMFTNEI